MSDEAEFVVFRPAPDEPVSVLPPGWEGHWARRESVRMVTADRDPVLFAGRGRARPTDRFEEREGSAGAVERAQVYEVRRVDR